VKERKWITNSRTIFNALAAALHALIELPQIFRIRSMVMKKVKKKGKFHENQGSVGAALIPPDLGQFVCGQHLLGDLRHGLCQPFPRGLKQVVHVRRAALLAARFRSGWVYALSRRREHGQRGWVLADFEGAVGKRCLVELMVGGGW